MAGRQLSLRAVGKPAPQGSKVWRSNGAMTESSPDLWPWRSAVSMAAAQKMNGQPPLEGPVSTIMVFKFTRPKSHYGTGKNAGQLRPGAPSHPDGPPDLDKLLRSTNDALTDARVVGDDAQICSTWSDKEYADYDEPAGALIVVIEMTA